MSQDIISLHLARPDEADIEPAEPGDVEQAKLRAATIRIGIGRFIDTVVPELAAAWIARDWATLGYESWDTYVDAELGVDRLRLSPETRRQAVAVLRMSGMSTRAIGAGLGVHQSTVVGDLREQDGMPEAVTGLDGRTYASTKPPAVDGELVDEPAPEGATIGCIVRHVLVRMSHGEPQSAELWELDASRPTVAKVVYAASRTSAWVARDRLIDPQCRHEPVCAYPCPAPDAQAHAAEVAAVAPEYVEPAAPDSDWLEPTVPGGAVTSATPGGPTAEAPADVDPDVEYDAWRALAYRAHSRAGMELANMTGGWDPGTFAERASGTLILCLSDMTSRLSDFTRAVLELRTPVEVSPATADEPDPYDRAVALANDDLDEDRTLRQRAYAWTGADPDRWIWLARRRGGELYHRAVDPGAPRRELVTLCNLTIKAGARMDIGTAVAVHGARPCPECWAEA